jgi:uncharacterized repeat protein (TIGR03803 family)
MKILRIPLVIVLIALAGRTFHANAQTVTTLDQLGGMLINGLSPHAGLVQGSDGNFYGTTSSGGMNNEGTVFKITTQGTLTTLWQFSGFFDGRSPSAGLVQGSDSNFYGTTEYGGTNGWGTVFKITSQGTLTTLWQFGFGPSGTNGAQPEAGLVQGRDGNFYGTTYSGGTNSNPYGGYGTVFKMTSQGTLTTLYQFGGLPTDGQYPYAGLVQGDDGNFYGTTSGGGTNNEGTVFKITPQGTLTTLWQFNYYSKGAYPSAGLVQGSDSNFYGTTSGGVGTVFKITSQGTLTTLWQFTGIGIDGAQPRGGLAQGNNGYFYGTTYSGGTNGYGTVFKITSEGTLTTLDQFSGLGADGGLPYAGLVLGSDSNFYGTTFGSGFGPSGSGTVFKMTPQGTLTTLWQFSGLPAVPANPEAGLVQGSDSNFYGTSYNGGTNGASSGGYGTIFKMTPQGTVTTLYQFGNTPIDGENPQAGLVQGNDGNFYGTTYNGGTQGYEGNGGGTVFRISSSGSLTILWSFCSMQDEFGDCLDGAYPQAGLVQGSDSNFYGTTSGSGSGPSGYGTVFKITSEGTLTTLWQFSGGTDGAVPEAGLVQDGDGDFYGTTYNGGTNDDGTVFGITPQGTLTVLYQFGGLPTDGQNPQAGLVLGYDGNFYGTTSSGGTNGWGTVFKITAQGTLTTLHQFSGYPSDGDSPQAGLVLGSDDNFYGTTYNGGTNDEGTVFKITSQGTLTTLWQFGNGPTDGQNPQAGLVQGDDGSFYGTTSTGGTNNNGTTFKLSVPLLPPPPPFQITSIVRTNVNDLLITWNTTGTNNIVQVGAGVGAAGSFSTNSVTDLTNIVVTTATTNLWDVGAATNKPARYYRIRSPQ